MSSSTSYKAAYELAMQEQPIVEVLTVNLDLDTTKDQVRQAIVEKGFDDCIFYWPKAVTWGSETWEGEDDSHDFHVHLSFPTRDRADEALSSLNGHKIYGRAVSILQALESMPDLGLVHTADAVTATPSPAPVLTVAIQPASSIANGAAAPGPSPIPVPYSTETPAVDTTTTPAEADTTSPSPSEQIETASAESAGSGAASVVGKQSHGVIDKEFASMRLEDGYHDNWRYNADKPDERRKNFFDHYEKLQGYSEGAGVQNHSRVVEIDGVRRFLPQQDIFSSENDKSDNPKTYVYITKRTSAENGLKAPEFKLVTLEDIEHGLPDGYVIWTPPKSPLDEDGNDTRSVAPIDHMSSGDMTYRDLERLYPSAVAMLKETGGENWLRGYLKGAAEAGSQASRATGFRSAGESGSLDTATPSDPVPIFECPAHIGVGWGGYDQFDAWRSQGRQVTKEMLRELEEDGWKRSTAGTAFVDEDGNVEEIRVKLKFFDEDDNPIIINKTPTLLEQIEEWEAKSGRSYFS